MSGRNTRLKDPNDDGSPFDGCSSLTNAGVRLAREKKGFGEIRLVDNTLQITRHSLRNARSDQTRLSKPHVAPALHLGEELLLEFLFLELLKNIFTLV